MMSSGTLLNSSKFLIFGALFCHERISLSDPPIWFSLAPSIIFGINLLLKFRK